MAANPQELTELDNPMALHGPEDEQKALNDSSDPRHLAAVDALEKRLLGTEPAAPVAQAEFEANQAPTSDTGYEFGNISVPGGHDPQIDQMVSGWMGELGLPTWVANSLYNAGAALTELPDEDTIDRQAEDAEAALRAEWGSEFDSRMDDIDALLSVLPDQAMEFLERTGLGSDLTIIKTLDNYVRMAK